MNKNTIIVIYISLIILLIGSYPINITKANEDLRIKETFDEYPIGQEPPGWLIPSSSMPVSPFLMTTISGASVDEIQNYSGRVLKVEKKTKTTASYNIKKMITPSSPKVVISYSVRAQQIDAVIYLPTPQNKDLPLAKFALYNGKFSYMKKGAATWTEIQSFKSWDWYDVRIVLDTEANQFDLYINGVQKLLHEPTAVDRPLTSISLGIFKESIGTVYFDNLLINPYKPAEKLSFAESLYDVPVGGTQTLPLTLYPNDSTEQCVVWKSSSPEIASVNQNGVVTGISPGSTTITAALLSGKPITSVTVNVYKVPIKKITLGPLDSKVPVGSRLSLHAAISPETNKDEAITWGSENPEIATVDRYGEITGVSPGNATLYAKTQEGSVRGEMTVSVIDRKVQQQLYVSPSGDDSSPGTEQKPFKTIKRAQEAVRNMNKDMNGDIIVNLRGGTYTLNEPLYFSPEDSGFNGNFVRYQNYPGESAIISGGKTIAGWRLHDSKNNIYSANIGSIQTRQLFINGVRATRARSATGLTNPTKTVSGYQSDDLFLNNWRNIDKLEFVYNELWTNPRAGVKSVSVEGGKANIEMRQPGWTAVTNKGTTSATNPIYYENAYELLDEPGEWYIDESKGMLYYKPRQWENILTATVTAPVLEQLLIIQGTSSEELVRNLQFEGLNFMYTTWMRPSTDVGHADGQNNYLHYPGTRDILPEAAIMIKLSNTINFKGNEFAKLGISAIRMEDGVQNSLIEGNHFYDLSGSALNIGQPYFDDMDVYNPVDKRLVMKNNDILNNLIHDIGVDYKSASAISAGYPVDMDISHNEIFSIPYSGTHIGFGWDRKFNPITQNVRIENNLIYDLLGNGLRDGGAIYSLGTTGASPENPNVVSGNYIRNQMNDSAVLYADAGSAYWKYENNVIDLKDSTWHAKKHWAMAWVPSIHDLLFNNNYTTDSYYENKGTNVKVLNTHVHPDRDWPTPAIDIINNSGLQPEYHDLGNEVTRRMFVYPVVIQVGGSANLNLYGQDGKDHEQEIKNKVVAYDSKNSNVATVDNQGNIHGVDKGITEVNIYVLNDSILKKLVAKVVVLDTQ